MAIFEELQYVSQVTSEERGLVWSVFFVGIYMDVECVKIHPEPITKSHDLPWTEKKNPQGFRLQGLLIGLRFFFPTHHLFPEQQSPPPQP